MKKVVFLITLIALLASLSPKMALAGCVYIGGATWSRINSHKIIMYRGRTAIALLDIPFCMISAASEIKLINEDVCDWDKIIIDGEACEIRKVERL